MSPPAQPVPLERAYVRRVLLAVEVLDAVTLARVRGGVTVVAEGLAGRPIVSRGGVFVWLQQDAAGLRRITVDPGELPYERVEVPAADVRLPHTVVELPPRADYPFGAGLTGLRGTLVEAPLAAPQPAVPVPGAEVRLQWQDEDGVTWRDAPTRGHTTAGGDFTAIARLAPGDAPLLDADGALTVRLLARRGAAAERRSAALRLPLGRIADPGTFSQGPQALRFAWSELQP